MMMKQLFRHTSTLLRTALLLGAMILVNTQTQAQNEEQLAKMPSAFDFKNPGDIINDGNYYYIQFRINNDISYLSDQGSGNALRSKDYIPFAKNLQWTFVSTGTANQFKLRSLNGIWAYLDNGTYKGTTDENTASTFTFYNHSGGGYDIGTTAVTSKAMAGNNNKGPWVEIYDNDKGNARCRLHVGKLKDNVAHIIYWQEPIYKDGSVVDRNADSRGGSEGFTQHHYLTYSGTNDNKSDVSSRKSILWYYDVWQLPTAAAYHQDGLWTLESGGDNGEFFIKKYGSEEYLNYDGNTNSVLGTKSADYGKYTLESPGANRYTRIQNSNRFVADDLTTSMYHWWDGWGANAVPTSQEVPTMTYNVGNEHEVSTSDATVIGDGWHVRYLLYADLTGYSKIVFEGTPGLELRVLMNRDQPNGSDEDGGTLLDWHCTIGDNGKGELSLSELAYAHLNSIKVYGGSGTISSIKLMKPDFVASSLSSSGSFYTWNGDGADAITTGDATVAFNVGNTVNARETIAGDGNVHYLTYANLTGSKKIIFEGTPGVQLRVLMNRQGDGGPFTEKTATISNFGKAEVDISDLPYVHLNAIKAGWSSPEGVITAIKVMTPALGGSNLFLSCANTDGNPVTQMAGNTSSGWYAGFLPVEVPVPNKDEYYQVVMGIRDGNSRLKLTGATKNPQIDPYPESTLENLYSAKFTPNQALTNVFQHLNLNVADYDKLVIEFGEPVPGTGAWNVNGIIGGNNGFEALTTGATRYEMDLTDINSITDLTIFNMNYPADPIVIKGIYLTPEKPVTQMTNYEGRADTYSEEPSLRKLWQLEQVDDFRTFRVKDNKGEYLKGLGEVTAPNDPTEAEVYTNQILLNKFQLKWFYVNPAKKEIPVNHWVTHRESYLKQYSIAHSDLDLAAQGLATKAQSDWWVYGKEIQKVNHFEITHYVKEGNSMVVEFPTVLNKSNDHVYYQRFYNYDEDENSMDLDNLKAHVSLDTRDDGNVQYFLYKNGMVTGQKLIWKDDQGVDIPNGGMARNVLRRFNFTNSDGKRFTVGVDVSRYSDLTYDNPDTPPSGDLEEPSLTMRYIYYMRDAKEMAASLTACPEGGSKWLETKEFHFPMRRIGYELEKKVGYQGEFIGVRHVFSDYWVFDDPNLVAEYNTAVEAGTDVTYLNSHLVSAVNSNTEGKIEVEIVDNDHGGTGIRLGGWNPTIAADHGGNLKFVDNTTDDWGEAEKDFKGYYFYDKMSDGNKTDYGNSRFVVFRYPKGGVVTDPTYSYEDNGTTIEKSKKAYVNVYLNNNGRRYQLAQYTIIFDPLTQTLPWKLRDENATNPVKPDANNPLKFVKDSYRDPKKLVEKAGKPIAKITFDYPANDTYHFPASGQSKQGWWTPTGGTIADCSPIPLTFGNTNYSFMGFECNWGSYSIVNKMTTNYGNHQNAAPANDNTHGYGVADVVTNPLLKSLQPDAGLQNGFLYIDASEQPGDICSAPFIGDFCSGDKLMFSGWISGSNKMGGGDNRCPGGVTLTVKGEHNLHDSEGRIIYDENGNPKKETVTLYRFCPGQCYELDDGPQDPDGAGVDGEQWRKNAQGQYIDENGTVVDEDHRVSNPRYDNNKYNVIWQQFYFEFSVTDKYDRHWIEVNNNCVSSQGGDFMLDNIEVYAVVPEVIPGINTPLCVKKDGTTEMRLLKLSVDFNKQISSANVTSGKAELGFVFLEKDLFLKTFRTELKNLTDAEKTELHLEAFNFSTISLDALADAIEDGEFKAITGENDGKTGNNAYRTAFDAAILGDKKTYYTKNEFTAADKNASIIYFEYNSDFNAMEKYSFAKAVNKTHAVYREEVDGEKFIVMNGNYPEMKWKANTDYYILISNRPITSGEPFSVFNLCSECNKASVFRIEPPYTVLGLEKSEGTDDYVVCEGQIPTVALNLKGYDLNGNPVDMKDLNFDWWLGNNTASTAAGKLATLENYHKQHKEITYEDAEGSHTVDVKLDAALAALRSYYPTITSLDGVIEHLDKTPNLSEAQVLYLQEVVKAGQLVLHQSSISVPAEKNSDDDPYFYLVACPIHDDAFNQALNPQDHQYVGYFCDEPQGLRIKVGQKAPTLKTGFVPGEHGFNTYDYAFPAGTNPVLSIRLAKAAQFETVKNSVAEVANVKNEDTGEVTYNHSVAVNYLWLPIRNAMTQTADGVIKKAMDDNIYLASTNDPTWDKKISKEMSKFGSLPVVGRIVQLTAQNTSGQSEVNLKTNTTLQKDNRLCVYFTKDFNVREGYNYTLSLPFQEQGDVNTCDGTILINLKIVPDYEVWTGGAGNTDWNNDENWRRADGNTTISNDYFGDELYRANGAVSDPNSPLHDYTTNKANYYSSSNKVNAKPSSDQILRKGFAPLYCTHILMKNDEWGNAPVLYDAIDGNENGLTAKPFPNLRDTSTPILKFDMQARRYDMWKDTYGTDPDRGSADRTNDLIAEMYQINSCDEIAMQPGTELLNAHLMNYNSAWMEYELDTKRWYLLGSPLQGTISGEWYAPTGTAQQKTTYYDDVKFGSGYDRYAPAIYQRSWDKAKAVLYEVESAYDIDDDLQSVEGVASQGSWTNTGSWNYTGADDYLDRLGYKPFGAKKANVAIKGIWSNTYNDAQVDYAKGGFSVMVMNHLKGNDQSGNKAIIRLPKEDTMYDYYKFSETGAADGGTDTNLTGEQGVQKKGRALNRGRLKTDLLLPEIKDTQEKLIIQKTEKTASRYGDQRSYTRIPIKEADLNTMNGGTFLFTENVAAGASNLGYYLVENPFPCGLDMNAFFAANTGLQAKYWILTKGDGGNPRQQLVQQADGEWFTSDGTNYGTAIDYTDPDDNTQTLKFYTNAVVAPGQGFFVQATTPGESTTITFNKAMQVQSRFGVIDGKGRTFKVVVGQSQEMRKLRKLVDKDGDGIPETESLETDNLGFETIEVDLDGDGIYGETGETEFVMVPVYETDDSGNYVLDGDGNKIPILDDIEEDVTIYKYKQETLDGTHNKEYPLLTRGEDKEAILPGLVITAQRDDSETSALVMQRGGASNDFLPEEDTEVFINSDLVNAPTVYTLCGRLATTINSIHDFRSLPIGVESTSDAPCTLTFQGVEMLGDSISFYDAVEQKLTPLESGMSFKVSGQTQNRYFLVRSLNLKDAAEETHLQIFTEGLKAKVIASTAEPITVVRCFDTAGRLICTASPQLPEYSFDLPRAGVYIIEAETEHDRKTMKVVVR